MKNQGYLTQEEIQEFSRLRPEVTLSRIALEYVGIIGMIWLTQTYWSIPLYIFAVIWIGARILAMAVLLHEGGHFTLHPNKKLNESVSQWFLAFPLFVTLKSLRKRHSIHHKFPLTEKDPHLIRYQSDPKWHFPKTRKGLLLLFLGDLTGINMIHFIRTQVAPKNNPAKSKDGGKKITLQHILYALIAVTSIVFGFWHLILLYWFVPLITWFSFIFRLREIGEHSAFEIGEDLVEKSRTVAPPMLEQLFLAPANISYHNEHHLFPNVPYYNLKRLHKRLMKNPDYKARGRVCKSYWGVIKECWQFTGRKIYEKQPEGTMPKKAVA